MLETYQHGDTRKEGFGTGLFFQYPQAKMISLKEGKARDEQACFYGLVSGLIATGMVVSCVKPGSVDELNQLSTPTSAV